VIALAERLAIVINLNAEPARSNVRDADMEHYRKRADDCRRHARESQDRVGCETLLRIVAQWDRLAQHKASKESEEA